MKIREITEKLLCSFLAAYLFLSVSSFAHARMVQKNTGLIIESQTLSADIKDVPLKDIFSQLETEKGLWFKCEAPLMDKKVSVRFKDLSIEDGLHRILAHFSHSLIFNKDGSLAGAYALENGKPGALPPMIRLDESAEKAPVEPEFVEIIQNVSLPGGISFAPGERELFSAKETPGESELFTVEKNAPLPGGLSFAPGERELFMVEKKAPLPSDSAVSQEKHELFNPTKDAPQTGETVPPGQEKHELGQNRNALRPCVSIQ